MKLGFHSRCSVLFGAAAFLAACAFGAMPLPNSSITEPHPPRPREPADGGSTLLGPARYASNGEGEIVPDGFVLVPEPTSVAAAVLLLGMLAWRERQRPVFCLRKAQQ